MVLDVKASVHDLNEQAEEDVLQEAFRKAGVAFERFTFEASFGRLMCGCLD